MSAEKKTDFHVVNHSIPRRHGRVKVTGKAQYVADLKLIGMAYAKVLRSPYAHAKIISIDKSRAEAHPGVYCVVTGYDLDSVDLGGSISCSGACLTVVDKGEDWFAVDVSAETISKTAGDISRGMLTGTVSGSTTSAMAGRDTDRPEDGATSRSRSTTRVNVPSAR